jgi:hypothetical protein
MNKEQLEKLESSLYRLQNKENIVYFLTYDTRNNARASVKHIYDIALTLKKNGHNAKILVEDKSYTGVKEWLGDRYDELEVVSIKDDRPEIKIEDILVVPEYYSNTLEQLSNIRCIKVMLVQQKEFVFETLPIGSKWIDYGFEKAIATTEATAKYINSIFPETSTHIIPPMIGDHFAPSERLHKPFVAISCRDRSVHKKLISEFYLKYPHLRWITFKDMIQLSYDEFAEALKECFVSVWVDDDSTFGTFPLESMKSGVPVIGKIPNNEPEWMGENGMWVYDGSKLVDILGAYVNAWAEGSGIDEEVKTKMNETLLPYEKSITEGSILAIFESFVTKRIEVIQKALNKTIEEA